MPSGTTARRSERTDRTVPPVTPSGAVARAFAIHGEEPALATWTARRRSGRSARSTGRRAASSTAMRWLARAGLAARGVMYVIIGWIAVQVAFDHSRQQADQTGA